jgi:drug/metabolite transporter superfamily protein YnfA
VPTTELNHPVPASASFGSAVAVSGTRVVVGAPYDNTGAQFAGQAYVYDLAGATSAIPLLTLANPNPNAFDYFGNAVAISGTRAIVASYRGGDIAGYNAGIVYIYDLASATPTAPAITLTNPATGGRGGFGVSLAASGTRLVVGEYRSDISSDDPGRAYVYDFAGATPAAPILTLTNPSTMGHGGFGVSVAISGTRLVVGASKSAAGALLSGSAYVYDLASATPARPVVTLTNTTPAIEDYFGSAVAISGARVVVGTSRDDTAATDAGAAYIYDLAGAFPGVPVLTLTNPSPAAQDNFAVSVAVSGTQVVIGAHMDDSAASDAGIVYVYDLASATPSAPVTTLNKLNPVAEDGFGQSVSIDGMTIIAGAPYADTTYPNGGAAYVFGVAMNLRIVPAAPGWATLSWPLVGSSGFVLQYTDSLAFSNWTTVAGGAANPVTISTTNGSRFYRLAEP